MLQNNSKKVSSLNNKGLVFIHVKSFIDSISFLGSYPLYVGSIFQLTLVWWPCDINAYFHARDEGHGESHTLLNVSTQK